MLLACGGSPTFGACANAGAAMNAVPPRVRATAQKSRVPFLILIAFLSEPSVPVMPKLSHVTNPRTTDSACSLPTEPRLSRVRHQSAQVGQARLAVGEDWGGVARLALPVSHLTTPTPNPSP